MRYRFTGAVVAMTLAAAVLLTVAPIAQQGRGNAPAAPAAGQGRGAARPAQIAGRPNLNGVWQAIGTAHWNLEDHSAAATPFWQLGAMFAIPAGQTVIVGGGTIPEASRGPCCPERRLDVRYLVYPGSRGKGHCPVHV